MSERLPNGADRRPSRISQIAQAYRTAHEIISGAVSLGLLAGGGAWCDKRFRLFPVLTIAGTVMGLLVAGVTLRQLMRRLDRESAREKQSRASKREQHPGA